MALLDLGFEDFLPFEAFLKLLPSKVTPFMAELDFRRPLHGVIVIAVSFSEALKVVWSRYHHNGYGYWWVRWDGFSHGLGGAGGAFLDAISAMAVALFFLEVCLVLLFQRCRDPLIVFAVHASAVLVTVGLCATDVVLFIVVGGARISLPLVFFCMSEARYILNAIYPWIHIAALSAILVAVALVVVWHAVLMLQRFLPARHMSWHLTLALVAVCLSRLWYRCSGEHSDGAGADMLSQLFVDAAAIVREAMAGATPEDMMDTHRVDGPGNATQFPPLLLFHWEAAGRHLINDLNKTATPFLQSVRARDDATAFTGKVTVPITLKSAWEVLCGLPPAMTSDFREHGSALRELCLPRVLAKCCGYHSILAKTDGQLNDMPKRVFGFDEVIFAEDSSALLARLHSRLEALGGLSGRRPVLVYFYEAGPHSPYPPSRVNASELGYSPEPVQDVYLALNRRADSTASSLARFWPPRPAEGDSWRQEHGAVIYFGDHGEVLSGDAPPHGHMVSPEVAEVMMLFEQRAFARPGVGGQHVRRFADVFTTVLDLCGLTARGKLHIGKSLFEEGHKQVASFSFYRPTESAAVSFVEGSCKYSAEFEGSDTGLALANRDLAVECPNGTRAIGPELQRENALAHLHDALEFRHQANALVTHSNVHAASWMLARLFRALGQTREAVRSTLRGGPVFPLAPRQS